MSTSDFLHHDAYHEWLMASVGHADMQGKGGLAMVGLHGPHSVLEFLHLVLTNDRQGSFAEGIVGVLVECFQDPGRASADAFAAAVAFVCVYRYEVVAGTVAISVVCQHAIVLSRGPLLQGNPQTVVRGRLISMCVQEVRVSSGVSSQGVASLNLCIKYFLICLSMMPNFNNYVNQPIF